MGNFGICQNKTTTNTMHSHYFSSQLLHRCGIFSVFFHSTARRGSQSKNKPKKLQSFVRLNDDNNNNKRNTNIKRIGRKMQSRFVWQHEATYSHIADITRHISLKLWLCIYNTQFIYKQVALCDRRPVLCFFFFSKNSRLSMNDHAQNGWFRFNKPIRMSGNEARSY